MRPFIVFNPAAGDAPSARRLRGLVSRLPPHELVATRGPGDAGRLAAEAAEAGYDPIVVAGGDGLLGEVVNGLAPEPGRVRLGLLPMGTGNDFARGLGAPRDAGAALEAVLGGMERRVDAGRVRARRGDAGSAAASGWWVVNTLVAGLAGRVARRADGSAKRLWGSLAYRVAALRELPRARPVATEIVIESEEGEERLELDAHAVAVTNGPFAGGGVPLAPDARLDDGWLDLVVVPDLGRWELSRLVVRLLAGRGDRGSLIRRRAHRVRLAMPETAWLDADGEHLPGREAMIEIVPGALRVLVPEGVGPGLSGPGRGLYA